MLGFVLFLENKQKFNKFSSIDYLQWYSDEAKTFSDP